eukprot:scaffold33240_cov63-Cyclotella_meneghiniana.AAC.2
MDDTQVTLIILANIEVAATQDYGNEGKMALQTIRRRYNYSHVHDATFIAAILTELAAADAVRQLKDAPAPSKGFANAVAGQYSTFAQLLQGAATYIDSDDDEGTAAATASDDDRSASSGKRGRKKDRKKDKKKSSKRDNSRSKSRSKIKHKCPHCKAQKRGSEHPKHIPYEKCNWNPDYKGYRMGWVCKILGIDYKPRKEFSQELGGYAKSAQTSSDESSSSSDSDSS